VLNFFIAGPDVITWDLMARGPHGEGPFELVVDHAAGRISEHFESVTSALARQAELEALLVAARGAARTAAAVRIPAEVRKGGRRDKAAPTILVVDDDRTVVETFATALHRDGFNVLTAASAEIGLREAAAHHADAIILDLRMPLINGLGFLYRLRTSPAHRSTPVAVVTGAVVDDSMQAELTELGAELRFKPLWLEEVVELARHLVATGA
jgi:two-component system chemotaxis response regulator CheY